MRRSACSPRSERSETSTLLAGPPKPADDTIDLATLRRAIRSERKLLLHYRDSDGAASERTVWPFALGFFERARVMVAWCELRTGFRHFRADRIAGYTVLEARYPRRRAALIKEWRALQGIPANADRI